MSMLTQEWLEDQTSIRCLLVEITARNVTTSTETTFYLSNMGYTTTNADVTYLPYLTGTLSTTESLGIDNNLSMSFGDIQVANLNGELDSWLDSTQYIWVNRTVRVYLGDPRWVSATLADVRVNFEKVFDGIVADVDSSARETINIKVRDKLQRLNYPLTDNVLGTYGTWAGGQTNQDTIRPLIFGEVFNINPVLIDPSSLEYMFNDTSIGTSITATTSGTNLITCNSTAGFVVNKPIVFTMSKDAYPLSITLPSSSITGTKLGVFGSFSGTVLVGMLVSAPEILPGTYITAIVNSSTFTVNRSQDTGSYSFTATATATSFGNIVANYTYYIKTIVSPTTFTISAISKGVALTLATANITNTGSKVNSVQAESTTYNTELLVEIRDNGVPIYTDSSVYSNTLNNSTTRPNNATVTLSTGKFMLTKPPVGTITCSVQGIKRSVNLTTGQAQETYVNNIPSIIALIVTQYGQLSQRLAATDIDLTNFAAFSSISTTPANINNASIGIPILDRTNALTVCQDIAGSVGAQLFFNRIGLLQLLQLGIPTTDQVMNITDNDILHHSLHISQRTPVVAATKVGYCQNYTPQTALASSLPGTANIMFADQWYSNTVVDTNVQSTYKLTSVPIQKDTRLIVGQDAGNLATFLNNYFNVPHTVYAFTGTAKLLGLKLGQSVTLTHNRFGLNSGKTGQVVTLAPDWVNGTVNVEVII